MAWKLAFSPGSVRDLKKLDRPVRDAILDKLEWFAANFSLARHNRLQAVHTIFYKLRVGDYRVLYCINQKERLIRVEYIDHRSRIYKRRR